MAKILLVDDEVPILKLFRALLEGHDFDVTTARSAAEAVGHLADESFDMVVTDLKMETPLAGFDVVRAAHQRRPRPVLVILTAFPVPASQWKQAGADALLVKGENISNLPEQLKALLSLASRVPTKPLRRRIS
jgi:CheY-like chemotaxis protein